MTSRTWIGPQKGTIDHNWFVPSNWNPSGVPQSGDSVLISYGTIGIGAGHTVDGEQVTLGSMSFVKPAVLAANGGTLGSGFTIDVGPSAPYAGLTLNETAEFDGTLNASNSQVTILSGGTISGSGTVSIAKGAVVTYGAVTGTDGAVPFTQTVNFTDANGTLILNQPTAFGAAITGFRLGDRIELGHGYVAVSASESDGQLTIFGQGGTILATLSLAEQGGPLHFHVQPFGHGGSLITTSDAVRNWKGGTGDWYNAAKWNSGVPLGGDTVRIASGKAIVTNADSIAHGAIDYETITLGAAGSHAPVVLQTRNTTFGPGAVIKTAGTPQYTPGYAPPKETWIAYGTTRFDGSLFSQAMDGKLVIKALSDGTSDNFIITGNPFGSFKNPEPFATVFDGQESAIEFAAGTITNNGLVQVGGVASIDAGVVLTGSGTIELQSGGAASISGSVVAIGTNAPPNVTFADGTGKLALSDVPDFGGHIELGGSGDRIDLTGLTVKSVSYAGDTLTLTGAGGKQLGQLIVTDENGLSSGDFKLSSDGAGGTLLTYRPAGPVTLQESLPVAAVGVASGPGGPTTIPLATLLTNAFGRVPAYQSYTLYSPNPQFQTESYWQQGPGQQMDSLWLYNGKPVTTAMTITPDQIQNVSLQVGNSIICTAFLTVPTATDAKGNVTEQVQYGIWTVDPNVDAPETAWSTPDPNVPGSASRFGQPDPSDMVSSAYRYNNFYPGVLNYNNCNWIADNVAAGAGAVMPYDNASIDPAENRSGGFWRIVYRGSSVANPVQDWFTLVKPGDVVRMGHQDQNGHHTTTIVGTVNPDGSIMVYDNGDHNSKGQSIIGPHDATYWTGTDPASITIYRLSPSHRYLIHGTARSELIQGSVFNNLILPGGGDDTITAGLGQNEIRGTATQLDGVTITDFHVGDTIDVTRLNPAGASLHYDQASGTLQVLDFGAEIAAIHVGSGFQGQPFTLASDHDGGSRISIQNLPPPTIQDFLPATDVNSGSQPASGADASGGITTSLSDGTTLAFFEIHHTGGADFN